MKNLEDCIAALDRIEWALQEHEAEITDGDVGPRSQYKADLYHGADDILRQVRDLQWHMRRLAARIGPINE
jgi:hypothetical protein